MSQISVSPFVDVALPKFGKVGNVRDAWLVQYTPVQIATGVGTAGTLAYNTIGIPLDRFRLLCAQDVASARPMSHWLRLTFASREAAFVGGTARIGMKVLATTTNLYIPSEWRRDYPFLSNFALGVGLAPLYNFPRVLQLGKVSGARYPDTFRDLFMSFSGVKSYTQNTAIWAPGEGVRMMVGFGLKDFMFPRLGGDKHPDEVAHPLVHTAKMAAIAGPIVAFFETTSAFVTESVSTVQAHMKTQEAKAIAAGQKFEQRPIVHVMREAMTPKFAWRCWSSLMLKNVANNAILFWFMFTSDFYVKVRTLKDEGR